MFAFRLRKVFPLLLHEIEISIGSSQNGNVADQDQTTPTQNSISLNASVFSKWSDRILMHTKFRLQDRKFDQLHVYK